MEQRLTESYAIATIVLVITGFSGQQGFSRNQKVLYLIHLYPIFKLLYSYVVNCRCCKQYCLWCQCRPQIWLLGKMPSFQRQCKIGGLKKSCFFPITKSILLDFNATIPHSPLFGKGNKVSKLQLMPESQEWYSNHHLILSVTTLVLRFFTNTYQLTNDAINADGK